LSKSVFISHAVKDAELAKEIVELIEEGMGVPESEIFCSSLPGYGIPSGQNFVTYIKDQMIEPKVVVLLLTPAYFESKFCLSELGAAWIKSHRIFPILVPPLTYGDVKDVLLGTQLANIEDDIKYNELYEALKNDLAFEHKSQTKWDMKRRSFLKAIDPLLKNIAGPSMVSAEEFNKQATLLAEAQAELDAFNDENKRLKKQLVDTEALKNKADVKAVQIAHGDQDVSEEFRTLIGEIKDLLGPLKSAEVRKFVLCNHYNLPLDIDWNYSAEEFNTATRYGYLPGGEGMSVNWGKSPMDELKAKLEELDIFVHQNRKELKDTLRPRTPLTPEHQDFWEAHYKI
jgi:hypothetical protein